VVCEKDWDVSGEFGERVVVEDGFAEGGDDFDEAFLRGAGFHAGGVSVGVTAEEASDFRVELAHLGIDDTEFGAEDCNFLVGIADVLKG
jgi:hypothetical protein